MSKTLQIQIAEEEEKEWCKINFLKTLKDTLCELYHLPIDEVIELVQSDEFKEDKNTIEQKFWNTFDCISNADDSLDASTLLESFGFHIRKRETILGILKKMNKSIKT